MTQELASSPTISPLQAELAQQIVQLAATEQWQPGTRLRAAPLALRLGVSRSPIRGALELLHAQGWVSHTQNRGYSLEAAPECEAQRPELPRSAMHDLYMTIMRDRAVGRLPAEVSEAELTTRYDTSRGAIRQALTRLAAEGLARRQRGHGWRFEQAIDTREGLDDSYRFRLVVECAGLADPQFSPDLAELGRMQEVHEQLLAQPAESIDRVYWFDLNADFHEVVARWSGNRFILQAVRMQNQLRKMKEYSTGKHLKPARIHELLREHCDMMSAIETGDLGTAHTIMRDHLASAYRRAMASFDKMAVQS